MHTFSKEQIHEITEQLDIGFRAFYHKQTGDLIFVPNVNKHYDIDAAAWQEEFDKLEENFFDFVEIAAMKAHDSFQVMIDFVEGLADTVLQNKLRNALDRKKPFREFKYVIDNVGTHRQHWFDFKNKRYMEWTEAQLKSGPL